MSSVALVHGVQASHRTFWRVGADLLDLGWDVRTPDLQGHSGRTMSMDSTLDDLADDLAEQVGSVDVLVGHSLGAVVALAACARHRDLASAVVLEDPPSGVDRDQVAAETLDAAANAAAAPERLAAQMLRANPLWHPRDAAMAVESRQLLDAEPVARFVRDVPWDVPALVAACPAPVVLVMASEGGSALREPARSVVIEALGAVGAGRVTTIPSGHGIHRDRPGLWLHAVVTGAAALGFG